MQTKEQPMTILITLSAIAIIGTIVEVARDGYGRVPSYRA
jgi:hypothetical protein